jgi:hypothetical protein
MNTKTFAQQARILLMDGVANKLLYWGFNADGSNNDEPTPVSGGYIFRGNVFDDEAVPKLWKSLQQAIKTKGFETVKEEAAYTWFNRMMALQIMAKNDYEEAQLSFVPGIANTPQILQKARQGQYSFLDIKEQDRLRRIINDFSKEQETFALLLVGYCHSNKMLNNVFGKLDDYTELLLPDNMLQDGGFLHLLNTTDAISDAQYKEVELIGWLYQFYISERKDEVFASFKKKKKAEAKDIPAATQIFTPNWIVKYMVQNTVGKIWLDKNPNSKIKSSLKYLVENESDSTSEPIISEVSQLTLIDPAAGSGHILVEGFDLLYQMYMEEYYTPEEAVESILKNNLFGLDLDDRAAQLAKFAILLKAAQQYRDVFAKGWLPNVHAMPEYAAFSQQEIKDFLGSEGTDYEKELTDALRLMEQSKNLGSIMKLSLSDEARAFIKKRFSEIKNTDFKDINTEIVYQKIKFFIPVLLILSKKYTAVVANPPYMTSSNFNENLKLYIDTNYPESKYDICSVFMEFAINSLSIKGTRLSFITLPSWSVLSSFTKFRKSLLQNVIFDSFVHLGRGVFGSDFGSIMYSFLRGKSDNHKIKFKALYDRLGNVDNIKTKEKNFFDPKYSLPSFSQTYLFDIPNYVIAYNLPLKIVKQFKGEKIENYFFTDGQTNTGKNEDFIRFLWEISKLKIGAQKKYSLLNKGGVFRRWYGNISHVIQWDNEAITFYRKYKNARIAPEYLWFQKGITWGLISISEKKSFRLLNDDSLFNNASPAIFQRNETSLNQGYLFVALSLLNSRISEKIISSINPTINCNISDILNIPWVNLNNNVSSIESKTKECISISTKDWNYKEYSFDFEKSVFLNDSTSLKNAYQKWQEDVTKDYSQLHSNEEELNRIFIEIYGLQDELTPEVALKDITILQEELNKNDLEALEEEFRAKGKDAIELPINRAEVISQFISYAIGLFMGRYRLDKPGLNIAHQNPTKEELSGYTYNHGEVVIDQDAILPLMGKQCNFSDDVVKQFNQLLDTIWGHEQRTDNINFIQECLNKEIDKFLVNDFWSYHCGMYKKTPIYWLFSSKKGAFQVLVYMHRMNEFTVEKIRANYLLEHLKYLKSEISQKEANASSLSTAEARQLDKLRVDLADCEQYDLALKNVADQQIKFDLDDGVAKNYELFETVVAKIK